MKISIIASMDFNIDIAGVSTHGKYCGSCDQKNDYCCALFGDLDFDEGGVLRHEECLEQSTDYEESFLCEKTVILDPEIYGEDKDYKYLVNLTADGIESVRERGHKVRRVTAKELEEANGKIYINNA